MVTHYRVQQGDTLGKIASKHGFSNYRMIYDHPLNETFRAKRPNPNLIYPGDIIIIPDKLGIGLPPPSPEQTIYVLSLPPLISQISPGDCWAAGLASFQRVTGINPAASRENLKIRYTICLSYDSEGSLPEGCVESVFLGEGAFIEDVPPVRFDYESAKKLLKEKGHFLAIRHSGNEVYHTMVVYGVGVGPDRRPNNKYFSVMNPNHLQSTHQAGYENLAFHEQKIVAIGTRRPPGLKHIHPVGN